MTPAEKTAAALATYLGRPIEGQAGVRWEDGMPWVFNREALTIDKARVLVDASPDLSTVDLAALRIIRNAADSLCWNRSLAAAYDRDGTANALHAAACNAIAERLALASEVAK